MQRHRAGDPAVICITILVNAPPGQAIGIKEDLAMYLERWGDSRVISVREEVPEQTSLL